MAVRTDRCRSQLQAIQQLQFVNAAMQVGSARANSIGEIDFITIFGRIEGMKDIGMNTKISTIIKHSQRAEDFLEDSLSRFTMEEQQIQGILEIPIGIFNAPAEMVKFFQLMRRE